MVDDKIYKTFKEWKDGNYFEDLEPRKKAYTRDELLLVEMGWNYGFDAGVAASTWQGLTDEEIRNFELWLDEEEEKHGWNPPADIVKYLEAKLREKNNGG